MARAKRRGALGGQFVPLMYAMLDSAAWHALCLPGRMLYIALRRRARPETNGRVFLSVRDATRELGVARNTAMGAYRDLQAKGLIVSTQIGHLGAEGQGKATLWRLTELAAPGIGIGRPTKDFLQWREGCDFPVVKGPAPRPKNQKPFSMADHSRLNGCDVFGEPVSVVETPGLNGCDVSGDPDPQPVAVVETHLESTSRGRPR